MFIYSSNEHDNGDSYYNMDLLNGILLRYIDKTSKK
jgi:hypothetical protein